MRRATTLLALACVTLPGRVHADAVSELLAETSASAQYESTRQFYLRTGFAELSNIPDFYRRDDGRLIFGLRVD